LNLIKVNVIGLDAFKKQLDSASKEIKAEVDGELQASAMEFVALAKRDLASQGGDRGTLLRSISYKKNDNLSYTVSANTFYAPFIEFGTKSKFNPYPGTEEFASQYRGATQSGSIKLIDAIKGWVKRKGIASGKEADRAAFLIARSIYKNGISPKPFFFKQIPIVSKNLYNRLNTILNGI
jgi:HK97 gp10 family phage protein